MIPQVTLGGDSRVWNQFVNEHHHRRRGRMMAPDTSDGGASCGCKGIRRCLFCEKFKDKGHLEASGAKVNIYHWKLYFKRFVQHKVI